MGGETLEQIEKHIDATRNQLGNNLNELEGKLRHVSHLVTVRPADGKGKDA